MMPEYVDKLLAILFSFLILGQGYLVRRMVGTWIFPACLFAIFWFVYTAVPLVFFFTVPVQPMALVYIFVCCCAFSLSAVGFNWSFAFRRNREKAGIVPYFNSALMRQIFYWSAGLSIALIIISSAINGMDLYSMIFKMFESAAMYTEKRYGDELDENLFGRVATLLMYVSPIIGGFLYFDSTKAWRKFLIVAVAASPSLFIMVTQSSKGALFLAMVFFYGAILLRKLYADDLVLFKPGFAKQLLLYITLLLPILTVSFLSRGLYAVDDNNVVYLALVRYFASYTSGHMYAFSDWFTHYMGEPTRQVYTDHFYAYGNYTFMAIFKAFGISATFPQGVFDEYFSYGNVIESNIYTMFRGLIYDFGGAGGVLFMFISGMLLHYSFYRLLTTRMAPFACALFICSLGYYYTSFIISLLMWNSVYVTTVLVTLLLYWSKLFRASRLRHGIPNGARAAAAGSISK